MIPRASEVHIYAGMKRTLKLSKKRLFAANVMSHLENQIADAPGESDVRDPNEVLDDFAPYIKQVFYELPDCIRELMIEEKRIEVTT